MLIAVQRWHRAWEAIVPACTFCVAKLMHIFLCVEERRLMHAKLLEESHRLVES